MRATNISKKMQNWQPPDGWLKIATVDLHTEGEPLRIILSGFPELPGDSILARRRYARENLDHLRTALMWEPRGHADMYGCIITQAVTPDADFGVLFLHNEGYSTMCGHAIIGVTKAVLETGAIPIQSPETAVKIDTPAGLVAAYARVHQGEVRSVYFHNVPSYVVELDASVDVPGLGTIKYDLAFGGAYYAYVQANEIGVALTPENYRLLIEKGMDIKRAVMNSRTIEHPFERDLDCLHICRR
jgi:trans-L-3-hydroxyproline dehydratase